VQVIDLSVYVLYLSVPSHALTFIAYVCCLHMFKCCAVCNLLLLLMYVVCICSSVVLCVNLI